MIWEIAEELTKAAASIAVKMDLLTAEQSAQLWRSVADIYSGGNLEWPLWEHVQDVESFQVRAGWRYIGEFLDHKRAIMLFDPHDESRYIRFDNGADIPRVLEEVFRFEFFVTDPSGSFLIGFNHHDFLFGGGSAKGWVAELRASLGRG